VCYLKLSEVGYERFDGLVDASCHCEHAHHKILPFSALVLILFTVAVITSVTVGIGIVGFSNLVLDKQGRR
jgi:hypothetical protein